MAKCNDCKGKGELFYTSESRSGDRVPYPERCKRCKGTGLGKLTAEEMLACGFKLIDTEERLALWREGTLVRHPVTSKLARVKAHMFKGHVILEGLDGSRHDIYDESSPQREDWQTVEPLFGVDATGAGVELKDLHRELENIEREIHNARTWLKKLAARLGPTDKE